MKAETKRSAAAGRMSKKAIAIPLPDVGDTVVVMGIVDHVDKDGLIFVKLLDRTLGPGAEYVCRLAFWQGAVFPVAGNIAVVSDAAKGKT